MKYSEPVGASAENKANYAVDKGITVNSVTRVDDFTVRLVTSKLAEGTDYTVTVNGVQDTAANPIAANTTGAFKSWVFKTGMVMHKFWANVTPNAVQSLLDDPRFPNAPTSTSFEPVWEYGPNGVNESGENYGNQLSGWFIPAKSGNYVFFNNSDDYSNLYLSTDENPANKKLIAQETGWSDARHWESANSGDSDAKRSDFFGGTEWPNGNVITLQAGKRYYMESLHTEGGGGDSVSATFIMEGEDPPVNGTITALSGNLIGTYMDVNNVAPVIDSATWVSTPIMAKAGDTLTLKAPTVTLGKKPYTYQWLAAGKPVANATSETLVINNLTAKNNGGYAVRISNDLGSVTTAPAAPVTVWTPNSLFIEAEDFDFGGGKYVTDKAIGMTGKYAGDAYRGLGTAEDQGIDYNANYNGVQPYRANTLVDANKETTVTDAAGYSRMSRGDFDVTVNNVVGWNDAGEWYNYTREFPTPAKDYYVIGRLASGGAAINSQLDKVTAGLGTANQTLEKVGVFNPGRATAGWDNMEMFPLTDDNGAVKTLNLGGKVTLRYTLAAGSAGDQDFFMFVPATGAATGAVFTSAAVSGANLVLTWATGTLEAANAVTGPWTAVAGATSPATIPISGTYKFYRLK
jgi:hypothetical protein